MQSWEDVNKRAKELIALGYTRDLTPEETQELREIVMRIGKLLRKYDDVQT